jgi:hypothetical protein
MLDILYRLLCLQSRPIMLHSCSYSPQAGRAVFVVPERPFQTWLGHENRLCGVACVQIRNRSVIFGRESDSGAVDQFHAGETWVHCEVSSYWFSPTSLTAVAVKLNIYGGLSNGASKRIPQTTNGDTLPSSYKSGNWRVRRARRISMAN